jgi:hypothetical protein
LPDKLVPLLLCLRQEAFDVVGKSFHANEILCTQKKRGKIEKNLNLKFCVEILNSSEPVGFISTSKIREELRRLSGSKWVRIIKEYNDLPFP